jgi:hypothetical protein
LFPRLPTGMLKRLMLDGVASPITRRVYDLGLDEFFEWYGRELRPGFTKATVRSLVERRSWQNAVRMNIADRPAQTSKFRLMTLSSVHDRQSLQ